MATLAETLHKRKTDWVKLEQLVGQLSVGSLKGSPGASITELSRLYRSACADLAMAEQYRLSPETTAYLHRLVGRAYNTLYSSRKFQYSDWIDIVFRQAPQQIFRDRCVHICAVLFFGLFSLSAYLAYNETMFPGFAEKMLGDEMIVQLEDMYGGERKRGIAQNFIMVAFYINHNTGIGLTCFALGPLIIPGLMATIYNASFLGAAFGYMARPGVEGGDNFLNFVTAHGSFELTAIALAAAAGLRIGSGWLFTGGLTRIASMQLRAQEAIPVMSASAMLFFLAALTEGMLSPTEIPYLFKAMWAMFSSTLLMFYFVVLGYPSESSSAVR
jgi:uncharacterized membrane protein SpoIIM required for sporulation